MPKEIKSFCNGVEYYHQFEDYKNIVESKVYRDGMLIEEK